MVDGCKASPGDLPSQLDQGSGGGVGGRSAVGPSSPPFQSLPDTPPTGQSLSFINYIFRTEILFQLSLSVRYTSLLTVLIV